VSSIDIDEDAETEEEDDCCEVACAEACVGDGGVGAGLEGGLDSTSAASFAKGSAMRD